MPGPRLAPPGAGRCAKTLRGRSPALNKSASKRRYLAARKTMDNSTRWGSRSTGVSYTCRKTLMAAGKDPRQWPSCSHFLALTFRELAEGLPGIPFLVGRAQEQLAFPQRRLSVPFSDLFLPACPHGQFPTAQIRFVSLLLHLAARHNMVSTLLLPARSKFHFRDSLREVPNVVQATEFGGATRGFAFSGSSVCTRAV